MPYEEPEGDDPLELVGVVVPADASSAREMATAFAEEFARLGKSRQQVLGLFRNPFYAGAHGVYRTLGEQEIERLVDEAVRLWGSFRVVVTEPKAPPPPSSRSRRSSGPPNELG